MGADAKPSGLFAARAREKGWHSVDLDAGPDAMTEPARLLLRVAAGVDTGRRAGVPGAASVPA